MRFLSELEATTLIVSEHLDRKSIETEFFLGRGEIRLHKWIDGPTVRRAISVEKFRGSRFDDRIRPMSITGKGLVVHVDQQVAAPNGTTTKGAESILELRIIDEVSNLLESALRKVEEAQRRQIVVKDIEVALSRAMVHFQRKNYQKAMKQALACNSQLEQRLAALAPPPDSTPPPPPKEVLL
jgi:hypothetical protein